MDFKKCLETLESTTNENTKTYTTRLLEERDFFMLCEKAKEIFFEESNIHPMASPITVVGDIHGQFYDLVKLFELAGRMDKTNTNYIFMGDYVDRGYHSLETLQYLLCLKVLYPERILLTRGNHESRQITSQYGFYEEINRKYGNANPWKFCCDLFDYLPLGAIIDNKIFCVHGGLSPTLPTIDQMRMIDRLQEIPNEGSFSDLMWSDPEDIEDGGWQKSTRGAGYIFGKKANEHFLTLNGLELVCRSHQLVQEGMKYFFEKRLVIVWSAPNYCYRCGNKATVMKVAKDANPTDVTFPAFDPAPSSKTTPHYKSLVPYFL